MCLCVHVFVCVCVVIYTFELPLCVEDPQVGRYGVKAAAPDDVDAPLQCLAVVLTLHTLQELHTHTHTHKHNTPAHWCSR